jgi:hypothetical protein
VAWAPDYVTADELKGYLRIGDNADDVFVALWVTTVSRNVDDHCGRQFGQTASEERFYTPVYDRHEGAWFVEIDDTFSAPSLADENGDAIDAADAIMLPRNAAAEGKPYERIKLTLSTGEIGATAPWGWTAVPAAVRLGIFLQGARLAARRDSPFGIAGSPAQGSELRLLAQLDVDFKTSLKPFVRNWWAR